MESPTATRYSGSKGVGGGFVKIAELELETHRFQEMKDFYSNVLGFKLVATDERRFKVQTGASGLTFKGTSDDVQPFYHFAFNIPENSLSESIRWLADRGVEFLSWGMSCVRSRLD